MSDEIRINRPPVQQPVASQPQPQSQDSEPKGGKSAWIILGLIVVVLIVVAVLFRGKLFAGKNLSSSNSAKTADASGYEAVFLTNGQVYFGKLSNADSDYPTLTDIYYLQVGPQQGSATSPTQTSSSTPQQQISLVKLGNELHGPEDQMFISRTQILFYEDLKSSGQVVKAILQDKAAATAAPAK
ncbi:MAG: hypothetical protein P4L74_02925 [Candidatus Doudnabacteria bacterium]|nr:hypothetical protein [Candidatus Doudnabacteria bacterium]